jgi:hypothetical protein
MSAGAAAIASSLDHSSTDRLPKKHPDGDWVDLGSAGHLRLTSLLDAKITPLQPLTVRQPAGAVLGFAAGHFLLTSTQKSIHDSGSGDTEKPLTKVKIASLRSE